MSHRASPPPLLALLLSAMLMASPVIACSPASPVPRSPAAASPTPHASADLFGEIEPQAGIPTTGRCDDPRLGESRVNDLFAALNWADAAAVVALFLPASLAGGDALLTLGPRFVGENEVHARTTVEVRALADLLVGAHFTFRAPAGGGPYVAVVGGSDRALFGLGFVWRATGPRMSAPGVVEMVGGGKAALDCETGLFSRVLFGPREFRCEGGILVAGARNCR